MLTDNGLWRIDSGVEAMQRYTAPKNVALFSQHGVLTEEECNARQSIALNHYINTVEIECNCMVDMINQHIIPSLRRSGIYIYNCLIIYRYVYISLNKIL